MPKISVVLPVYNGEMYIKEAVTSILEQTFNDFSLNVIDDGSSDNTIQILKEIGDRRLKIHLNESNKGLIYSLNKGIMLSGDCEYIARMDADDISLPSRFASQVNVLNTSPGIGLVGSSVVVFGNEMSNTLLKVPEHESKIRPAFICKNPIIHPTVMMRTDLFTNFNFQFDAEYPKYEDYKLWLELLNRCTFFNIAQPLVKYRRHNNNVTNVDNYNLSEDLLIFKRILGNYANQNDFEFDVAELRVLSFITSTYRWKLNTSISTKELSDVITRIVNKHRKVGIDKGYLSSLLWERAIIYLIKCKRIKDVASLILQVKVKLNFAQIYKIQKNWF